MRKNAFTLIELLSVIVIFAITFLIVVPSMNSLIGSSEKREIELIEERVLSAAKEYVNNFDGSFYKNFYKEGDTSYVYKSDLINAGLIDENEISKLNTFAGVKGELLSNERIRYTVEYINASSNEYTNEELYLMIKNLQNQSSSSGGNNSESDNTNAEAIEELQNQINNNATSISNLIDKDNINNVFLQSYPVGSIYITENNTNPGTKFGGTWVAFGAGRTLVGVDSSQTEFASVGLTGGEKKHTLIEGELPSIYGEWAVPVIGNHATKGKKGNAYGAIFGEISSSNPNEIAVGNRGTTDNSGIQYGYGFKFGNNQPHNNLQPYITVYMWKRTA